MEHNGISYIWFWRLKDPNSYLCQWYKSPFKDHTKRTFNCAEQYMMFHKAMTFGDIDIANTIMMATDAHPSFYKGMGRKVKQFDFNTWLQVCDDIVLKANLYKFSQNKQLLKLLLETDTATLVEASAIDRMWGIGYAADSAIANIDNWGENRLGKILMKVRNLLKDKNTELEYEVHESIYIGFAD